MLTRLQDVKHKYIFDLIDVDGNGYVEKDDFEQLGQRICLVRGEEIDSSQARSVQEQTTELWQGLEYYIDENGDDKCTIEEWLQFIDNQLINGDAVAVACHITTSVGKIFDLYDLDGNGSISLDEYMDIFLSFRLNASLVARSFLKLDDNGDGSISKLEFTTAVNEFLVSDNIEDKGNWIFGDIFSKADLEYS